VQLILPVIPHIQEGFYTCWSTSAEMIMHWVAGTDIHQCEQADHPPPGHVSECCDASFTLIRPGPCDHPGLPSFGDWGIYSQVRDRMPLSWEDIVQEINAGRPIAFSMMNDAETFSHMMVIIGYQERGSTQTLWCLVPYFGVSPEPYPVSYAWYSGMGGANTVLTKHQYDYFMIW
jgi:hypothetical protein